MRILAQCEYCRKYGLFSNDKKYRICTECLNHLKVNFQLIYPVIQELVDLAEISKDKESKTRYMDTAIQRMKDLIQYDRNGIFNLPIQLHLMNNLKQRLNAAS